MSLFEYITGWINNNPGKSTGAFIGFILGIFILSIGLLKTIFVIIFILTGIILGKFKDDNISLIGRVKGIFSRKKQ